MNSIFQERAAAYDGGAKGVKKGKKERGKTGGESGKAKEERDKAGEEEPVEVRHSDNTLITL
jgi:hypothetical protein